MSKPNRTERSFAGLKWGLILRTLISFVILMSAILTIHIADYPWFNNLLIVAVSILMLYISASFPHSLPSTFKRWYSKVETHTEFDTIEMQNVSIVEMPNRDSFWEYLSVLLVLVLPLSFFGSFAVLAYSDWVESSDAISVGIPSEWVATALITYLLCVGRPVFKNLVKHKNNQAINVREYYEETEALKDLQQSFADLDTLLTRLKNEESDLRQLKIPVPKRSSVNNQTPYIEFFEQIEELRKSNHHIATLEQCILNAPSNIDLSFPNIEGWEESLTKTMQSIGHVPETVMHDLGESVHKLGHFISNPDKETWACLSQHILERLQESKDSPKFKLRLIHAEDLKQHINVILNEIIKDVEKGAFDTFKPEDLAGHLNHDIVDIGHNLTSLGEHFIPDYDLPEDGLFSNNFEYNIHFPIISTAREAYKNLNRYIDGDVDMTASLTHSATTIGGAVIGAKLGATIGTLIFPGAGTLIGSAIGGFLGKCGADKLNALEFNRIKNDFEKEKSKLDELVVDSQKIIENKQNEVNEAISKSAEEANSRYQTNIIDSPLKNFKLKTLERALIIVVYDYIWQCAEQYSLKNKNYDTDKYDLLLNCLPNRYELTRKESSQLYRMLYELENLIRTGTIEEPRYMSLSQIYRITYDVLLSQAMILQSLHLVWMERTRKQYVYEVYSMMQTIETEFKAFDDVVKEQEKAIVQQADKCKDLADAANKEAKTL